MAPIKFEENIKDKLEKRSIQPSTDAWNKLSNQLDTHDKKNSRSWFLYIGIAASIVGVLFVTTLFFKSSEEQSVSPILVDTEIKESLENKEIHKPIETIESKDAIVEILNEDAIEKTNETKMDVSPVKPIQEDHTQMVQISEQKAISIVKQDKIINDHKLQNAVVAIANEKNSIEKKAIATNTLTSEDAKVLQVVNQIKALDTDGTAVTSQEIEDLLKQAEKDILKQRIYNETTRTVDADALLQDVEADLEQSFRTKVFEALRSSYNTVKTAVAERNN
ncbi:hypothetical protein [uncultured Psychroserpens sp.]|uniref:hypothetical protein n=1 Tax=uncultured Psychroserpens sp. TaxID=255436 RepID=UPI0026267905|nr:hypothetical protein [uncultured Psychroserpens sp.]